MTWTQKALWALLLVIFISNTGSAQNAGLAQPADVPKKPIYNKKPLNVSGKWKLHYQQTWGTKSQTANFILVVEHDQWERTIAGKLTDVATGRVTEIKDGSSYHGNMRFQIESKFEGKPIIIEISGKVKDGNFGGTLEYRRWIARMEVEEIFDKGQVTGRKVANEPKADKDVKKPERKNIGETVVLFDGSNLDSFRGYKKESIGKGWKIDEGLLYFDGTKSGDIITKEQYGSFELTFDWKISAGSNSGVVHRVLLGKNKASRTGIEYQIVDNLKHKDGKKPETSTGAINRLYSPEDAVPNAPGQWNSSKDRRRWGQCRVLAQRQESRHRRNRQQRLEGKSRGQQVC